MISFLWRQLVQIKTFVSLKFKISRFHTYWMEFDLPTFEVYETCLKLTDKWAFGTPLNLEDDQDKWDYSVPAEGRGIREVFKAAD